MNSELKNEVAENTVAIAPIEHDAPGVGSGQSTVTASAVDKSGFTDPGKKRREKIKKLEAQLEREIARDNAATRKERDGQLFVWGAMVEGVYRGGNGEHAGGENQQGGHRFS